MYRLLTRLLHPLLGVWLRRRMRAGKEDARSLREKLGVYEASEHERGAVWIHAVSVGETRSVLPLVHALRQTEYPVLLTGGTQTGAATAAPLRAHGVRHVFAPVDTPQAVDAFLRTFRPRVGVLIDSELWPNLLRTTRAHGIPMLLLNGRLSDAALQRRLRQPRLHAQMLASFAAVFTPDEATARRFRQLGAPRTAAIGNLKAGAMLDDVPSARAPLHGRRCWAAVSLHPSEFDLIAQAQQSLDTLCIFVPRHPQAADAAAASLRAHGLRFARRSHNDPITPHTQVYLADTLGETGAWYRAADVAVIGGSFYAGGEGHNPYEALLLGVRVLHGPHGLHDAPSDPAMQRLPGADAIAASVAHALTLPRLPTRPPTAYATTLAHNAIAHLWHTTEP